MHSHTDRANEASRIYGDRNKFEFPLRCASGVTCEFICASARGGRVMDPDERVEKEKTAGGQNAKARKKLEQRERSFSLS